MVGIAAAAGALAMLAAGCGDSQATGSSSNAPAASTPQSGALAFSGCMRSHGVADYPDPSGSGVLVKETPQQLGVGSSRFQAAQSACIHLLPGAGQPTGTELRQSWGDFLSFARCMRRHGVPTWPDPSRYPQHPDRPTFELQTAGIDPNAPQLTPKIRACEPLLEGVNPQHLGQG
jgi:hypothetical protein